MEIKRDLYLNRLIESKHNRLVKVVTGVRRCGKSYLLNTLFKKHLLADAVREDHIIEMAFDLFGNKKYRDPDVFFEWVVKRIKDGEMHYILLDEVQMLGDFVSVLNDLAARENCDVYVTGSNAKFLSKDIATEFGGRSLELHMHPLSFSEFMSVYDGHRYDGLREYMIYGGIPLVVLEKNEETKKILLRNLITETYLRDIVKRYRIRNVGEMDALLNVISSATGALTNPHKLENSFKTLGRSSITSATIAKYIQHFKDSFLLEEAKLYDVKGKKHISFPMKYYFTDYGLRNAKLDFRQIEPSHAMENIVYNELRIRGFDVDVGHVPIVERDANGRQMRKELEIDFICVKGNRKFYVQSAYSIDSPEKFRQEIRPLSKVHDAFGKILVAFDVPQAYMTEDGIQVMSVFDLVGRQTLA